jgi:hypothetical protein
MVSTIALILFIAFGAVCLEAQRIRRERKPKLTHTLLMRAMTEANIRVMQGKPRATTQQVLEDWELR